MLSSIKSSIVDDFLLTIQSVSDIVKSQDVITYHMNSRISLVVTESGLTKTAFGKKIGLSQSMISMLCNGSAKPSDRTLADISRKFNVPLKWLKDGEGPMRLPDPEEDLDHINILMENCDSPFGDLIRAILVAYDRSTPTAQKAINDYIDQILSELDKRK